MEGISVLGSTGSIGVSTLEVVARHLDKYRVIALSGYSRLDRLVEQCRRFQPRFVVVPDREAAATIESKLPQGVDVLMGTGGLSMIASHEQTDIIMAAIVGAAGLVPTLAAVRAGKKVLLANKEALVMAGPLFMETVRTCGATLLPIDSEHNAIFQCLPQGFVCGELRAGTGQPSIPGVRKLLLSGSGGPFRETPVAHLSEVTPDQACTHPNWRMGRKISVDSATMMNKGLELIEACWLFDVPETAIEIVIHPESIVHSLVEYTDGSVLAQLGNPDMRTPIAHALAWPERIESGVASLDLAALGSLRFEAPNIQRFPCLGLARAAAKARGDAPAALNAANEVAVAAFLDQRLPFTGISEIVDGVMQGWTVSEPACLEAVQEADVRARDSARRRLGQRVQ